MRSKVWVCALALWCWASALAAGLPGAPLFRSLGTSEGVPSNAVHSVRQDRAGYLWIATGDGLARYDGVQFDIWQHDPADPASLPSNTLQALHIDARDRIWIGTEGGALSMLDVDRRGFTHYSERADPRFALADVWTIVSDDDGVLWFGGYGSGLYRFDPARDAVQVFRHDPADPDSLASDHVISLAIDAADEIWVGTSAGLARKRDIGFERMPVGGDGVSSPFIASLTADPDGSVWIGTRLGLDVRRADGSVQRALFSADIGTALVLGVVVDRAGTRWFATAQGLKHLSDGALRRYPLSTGGSHGPLRVNDAFEDHEGGLWFATAAAGLQRLPPNWRNFSVLAGDRDDAPLSIAAPSAIAEAADAAYWVIGKTEGLDHVAADGRLTHHLDDELRLPPGSRWSILEVDDGVVWIGQNAVLSRYTPRDRALQSWAQGSVDAPPAAPIDLLRIDRNGELWLAANGVGVQRRASDGRVLATWSAGDEAGFPDGDIDAIEFGPDGELWLACGGGLHRFDATANRFALLPGSPLERIHGFDFVGDGTLWLQRSGALERYRIGATLTRLERVDAAQGLPAVSAGGIRVDARGEVWMTSPRGLFRWSPERRELRQYGIRDGLPSPEFNLRPPLRMRSGVITAIAGQAVVSFDPARIEENRLPPRLRLERATVLRGGRTVELDPAHPLALDHSDRELRIAARLLSFAEPSANRYRFRLDGFDEDWIDAGANGNRVYSSLPSGRYRFEAVGANAAGVWSAPPLALDIAVAPPWWETLPAQFGFALALVAAVLLAAASYRRQTRRRMASTLRRQKHELTQRASDAKSSFLATLGHEIRTPMTGVLGMAELLLRSPLAERQRSYAESIQRSGEVLLRLVNDALDLARVEAGRLDLADAPLDLAALLSDVQDLLTPLAERKQLPLGAMLQSDAPRWVRGDVVRLKQILLNLGSNALKFTEHGEVELRIGADASGGILFVVRDTGPGLNADQRARLFQRFSQAEGAETTRRYGGSGLGLAICQELTAAMGGRIDVDSEAGRGSTFVVHLPLPPCDAPVAGSSDIASGDAKAPTPDAALRILLVEDDVTVAQVVGDLLALQGHRVAHVAQGLAALTELSTSGFDLAFLDLDLPGLDGLSLAGLIRGQGHALPMIALTARADLEAEPQARAAGMIAFLRKPVSGEQLAQAVREARTVASG